MRKNDICGKWRSLLQPKEHAGDRCSRSAEIHTSPPTATHHYYRPSIEPPRSDCAVWPLMALIQFRALQCVSKWSACIVHRGLRTAASQVKFSVPLDDYDEDYSGRTRAPSSSTSSVLPKRDWKTYTPKPPPSLKPHSDSMAREPSLLLEEHERPPIHHTSKEAMRKPTPAAARLHRDKMKNSFPEGWSPPHKLSRQAMDGLRVLHAHDPKTFSTPVLAERFRVSPEAVRRMLRSGWEPSPEQRARLLRRELRDKQAWIEEKRAAEREDYKALIRGRQISWRSPKN